MRNLSISPLSQAAFQQFGWYRRLPEPEANAIGEPPITFFRDLIGQPTGSTASYSICRMQPRPLLIDTIEHHNHCHEAMLPLTGDMIIHVAPAVPLDAPPPLNQLQAFRFPRQTMVILRPGVWHHAAFALDDQPLDVLIVLPERTYANDCIVAELEEDRQTRIER